MKKPTNWLKVTGVIMTVTGSVTLVVAIFAAIILVGGAIVLQGNAGAMTLTLAIALTMFPIAYAVLSLIFGIFLTIDGSAKNRRRALWLQVGYIIIYDGTLLALVGTGFLTSYGFIGAIIVPLIVLLCLNQDKTSK